MTYVTRTCLNACLELILVFGLESAEEQNWWRHIRRRQKVV